MFGVVLTFLPLLCFQVVLTSLIMYVRTSAKTRTKNGMDFLNFFLRDS